MRAKTDKEKLATRRLIESRTGAMAPRELIEKHLYGGHSYGDLRRQDRLAATR